MTDSCKFPAGDYGVQNFNFAPEVPQNGSFQTQIWHFWIKIFRQKDFPTIFQHDDTDIDHWYIRFSSTSKCRMHTFVTICPKSKGHTKNACRAISNRPLITAALFCTEPQFNNLGSTENALECDKSETALTASYRNSAISCKPQIFLPSAKCSRKHVIVQLGQFPEKPVQRIKTKLNKPSVSSCVTVCPSAGGSSNVCIFFVNR